MSAPRGGGRSKDVRFVENAERAREGAALVLPQIPNRPLMDTMEAVREAPARYDTHFSAHVVPTEFLYVPHGFDARGLAGIDAVEAWLRAMLAEAHWLARFDTVSPRARLRLTRRAAWTIARACATSWSRTSRSLRPPAAMA